ncbi:MAG TPA: hypothetical protein VMW87_14315 [Spirochaetia bacterium]|nr:hypothetical protein [Spirochaetia bacterium]
MNSILATAGRIVAICIAGGLVLALFHIGLAPVIAATVHAAEMDSVSGVAGQSAIGAAVEVRDVPGVVRYFPLSGKAGATTGYVVVMSGEDYAGPFAIFANCRPSGEIVQSRFVRKREGPPLGPDALPAGLMSVFTGTGGKVPVPATIDGLTAKAAQTVSGATVTFVACGRLLAAGTAFVESLGGKK